MVMNSTVSGQTIRSSGALDLFGVEITFILLKSYPKELLFGATIASFPFRPKNLFRSRSEPAALRAWLRLLRDGWL